MLGTKQERYAVKLQRLLHFPYWFLLHILNATANLNNQLQIGFRDKGADVVTDLSEGYGSSSDGKTARHC